MKNISALTLLFALLFTIFATNILLDAEAQACNPSGTVRGEKPPPHKCTNNSDCCVEGELYTTYECSTPVTQHTKATLTLGSFERGGPSECDDSYHSDEELVVALSTGWFEDERRCFQFINITAAGNGGKSVLAKVVDECDSSEGCDDDHDYQPPCPNDVVQGSRAVWDALGVAQGNGNQMNVTWSVV
ncbi:Putative ripening-related protein 2 [Linum grandiflorum]